ncbi:hypothetical protein HY522_06105 [bacterium]|nr:hypothetical protein [bacterium]
MSPSYIPKEVLPYPVGRLVSGRIIARLSNALYRIDLSGRHYVAEVSTARRGQLKDFAPGDPVMVRVVEKQGSRAVLEIEEPDFPDIRSPSEADLSRLAQSAGWPDDAAARALVAVLVARRLPLRSDQADQIYRKLKALPEPTRRAAELLLVDHP